MLATLHVAAPAQAITFILVERQIKNVQTDASTTSLDGSTPYIFDTTIQGNSLTGSAPITGAAVTAPGGSAMPLAFNSSENKWIYQSSFADSTSALAAYANGTYSVALTNGSTTTVTTSLTDPSASTVATPLMTLSGGNWVSGQYVVNPNSAVTINFNSVLTAPSADQIHYDVSLDGNLLHNNVSNFLNTSGLGSTDTTPPTYLISAGTLAANTTYTFQVSYADIQSFASNAYGSATLAGLFQRSTTLTISTIAVPEPATFGLLAGCFAFAGLLARRRRHQA